MMTVAVTAMGYLLLVPLAVQVLTAFRGPFLPFGVPSSQWGLDNFRTLLGLRSDLADTFVQTALFVGGSTLLAGIMAFVLAWLVARTNIRYRALISALVVVPYIIPPIVKAQAYYLMLSPKTGVLNELLRALPFVPGDSGPIDPFSFTTLIFVQGFNSVTFPFLLLLPLLSNMDGGLEEAARVSGASWWQTIRRITWPMLWPGTLGILVLNLILNLGSLEVPLLFGQQSGSDIFALKLWNLIQSDSGELPQYGLAAAWGVQFLIITSVLFWLYLRSTRHAESRASVTGKGFRPGRLDLGGWRWATWVFVAAFLLLTAALPLLALIWTSVTPYPLPLSLANIQDHFGIGAYGQVLTDGEFWASLGRTVVIGVASATLAVAVASVVAYGVARSNRKGRHRILDLAASASVAVPATIAGFSSFMLYLVLNKWVPISGTLIALILAYSYRVSIAYRTNFSATLQIGKELEEAAALSGASKLATFRRVVLPLLMPSIMVVWVQMFILGANEFTLPAFLATPESQPLSLYLFSKISSKSAQVYAPDQGAAMAVIFTLLVVVVGYGLQHWIERRSLSSKATGRGPTAADPAAQGDSASTPGEPRDDRDLAGLAPSGQAGA